MIWHSSTPDEVIFELKTNKETGLENRDVAERLKEYGPNFSVCENDINLVSAIVKQIQKPSLVILLALLIIYVLRELVTGNMNFILPIIGTLLLILKVSLCIFAEYKSRNMIAKLQNRIKTSAKVIRNNTEYTVPSEELVPGDIIKLTEGDYIPADARIIEAVGLRCDEAVLLNEKEAVVVVKDAEAILEDHTVITNRVNMLFCGCRIISGDALAVVTETGEETEIRRAVIKDKVFSNKDIQDRIAVRYRDFFKIFQTVVLFCCALIVILGTFLTDGSVGWGKFLEALIAAVAFYIVAVPGSFATRVACLLALGIKRFEKDKAVIFNAQTIEKLAGVTVICSDKTGTLTQNKMSLQKVYDGDEILDLDCDKISKNAEIAMRFAALCCENESEEIDHTEAALISAAAKHLNIIKSDFDSVFPRITSIPLTPERKIKTSVNMLEGRVFSIVRGAPDIILSKCVNVDSGKITKAYEELCNEGLRVLAISYKILDTVPTNPTEELLENNLQFLGLLAISDRQRRGIVKDIELCKNGGISTIMFTGDHINTAASIAQKLGILQADDLSVTGEQLESLNDVELVAISNKIKVCARFSSEERIRMVNALQANGETVLITADSAANTTPMAYADVGCAMGKTGTDVAKSNADVMIYDDSFSTIVKAIKNARGIFGNFIKYINYYVALCTALFVSIIAITGVSGSIFPSSTLILLSSIFTLVFPILSIGFETADIGIMKQTPRAVGEKLFDLNDTLISIIKGITIAIPAITTYILMFKEAFATTAAFTALVITLILYMLSERSTDFFFKRILRNRFLLAVSLATIIVTILLVTTPLGHLFGLTALTASAFFISILIPLIVLLVFEGIKVYNLYFKK